MTSKLTSGLLAVLAAGLLAGPAAAGTVTYYHSDLSGSPVEATNQAGQVIWRESYRPYGERLVNSPAASGNSVWFTSRRQDAESGLVYMGARHYDPVAGRFVSMDPVCFDEGNIHSFNRYAYANNSPYRYVDPDGRSPVLLLRLFGGGAIGGAAGAAADAVSQYAAFGSVDWGMAAQLNAAQEGAAAGALSFLPAGTPAGLSIKAVGGGAAKGATEVIEGAVSAGARTEARNLAEQLTLKEAQAGAGQRIMQGSINDPRFPADTWAKMQHVRTTPQGENIVVHYWEQFVDGLRTGFKFKD